MFGLVFFVTLTVNKSFNYTLHLLTFSSLFLWFLTPVGFFLLLVSGGFLGFFVGFFFLRPVSGNFYSLLCIFFNTSLFLLDKAEGSMLSLHYESTVSMKIVSANPGLSDMFDITKSAVAFYKALDLMPPDLLIQLV